MKSGIGSGIKSLSPGAQHPKGGAMAEIVSNQIPQELKQYQAWVNWKSEQYPNEKKPGKFPTIPKQGIKQRLMNLKPGDLFTNL